MPSVGRLRYLERAPGGAGSPAGTLVLLHAFPLNAHLWEPQLALSDGGWRVIAPDFRGFGAAGGDPPATSVDDYAGDVLDLLDVLQIRAAVIAGLSLGGYVAFALLRKAPGSVRALVLADTRAQADPPEAVDARTKMIARLAEKGPSAVADEMVPRLLGETTRATRPAVAERVRSLVLSNPPAGIVGGIRAIMTRPDSTPLLPAIRCPTLIVVGDEDTLTPPSMADAMHQGIAGSELAVIGGAGHLSSLEQPEAFNAAVARLLAHRV